MSVTMSFWIEGESVRVPDWVNDLESFRRWTDHDDFPEHGRIAFLRGAVWIDMSKEQLFSHNAVKAAVNSHLYTAIFTERLGSYFHDGVFISNEAGDVSNQPDRVFVSSADLAGGRVRVVEGPTRGFVELEGSPSMVLEVVSDGSVDKDTSLLRTAYAAAGIAEYWLIDARGDDVRFDVLALSHKALRVRRKSTDGGTPRPSVAGSASPARTSATDTPLSPLESRIEPPVPA